MVVNQTNKALEGKLDGIKTGIEGLRFQVQLIGGGVAISAIIANAASVLQHFLK